MSVEENKAVVRRYLDAVAAGDLGALDECVAPTYVRHDPGLPFQVHGLEGVKQLSRPCTPPCQISTTRSRT